MVNTKTANRNSAAETCTGIRLLFRSTHPGSQIASFGVVQGNGDRKQPLQAAE
jgi:hypothetical protein